MDCGTLWVENLSRPKQSRLMLKEELPAPDEDHGTANDEVDLQLVR
jgi:hypothetical protein